MAGAVNELLLTPESLRKLGRRGISQNAVEQLGRNRRVMIRNVRGRRGRRQANRRLLIGCDDGGRVLTLVIDSTVDPTTWILVTGWVATATERKIWEER